MSVERVYALLGIPSLQTGNGRNFGNQQLIFPSITFTCSGEVVKWIMAGRWNNQNNQDEFPELQIWRSSGDSTYHKQNSTVISVTSQEDDDVYEFPVAPPLPFQPGDILGLRQPRGGDSRLQVRYDNGGDSVYYGTRANQNNDIFDISGSGVDTSTDIPLVTVEIGKLYFLWISMHKYSVTPTVEHNPSSNFIHQTSSPIVSTMISSFIQSSSAIGSRVQGIATSSLIQTSSAINSTVMSSLIQTSSAIGSRVQGIATSSLIQTSSAIVSRVTSISSSVMTDTSMMSITSPMTSVKNNIGSTAVGDSIAMSTTTDTTETISSPTRLNSVRRPFATTRFILNPSSQQPPSPGPLQTPAIPPPAVNGPESVDRPESGDLETGAVVGLVLGVIILLLLAVVTASLSLLLFHKKRHRKQDLKEMNSSGLDNPNYGK